MKNCHLIAALPALVLSVVAHAASVPVVPVALLTPVSFGPGTDDRAEVKEECKLGEQLEQSIGAALHRVNKGPGTTTSEQGDTMKVTVVKIWGARGNSWTGPKGMVIHVDLMHDGKLERSTDLHRTSLGGFAGPFMGICGFMERNAGALAKDVARWSRDSGYVVPDEPAPAEQPQPQEPAASDASK